MAKSKFRYLEEIATADAAFEAYGSTLAELFENCALATFNVIVPIELIQPAISHNVEVSASSMEDLLYAWLSELVYLKDVNGELYCAFEVAIKSGEKMTLSATVSGNSISSVREQTQTDVKAVTYHRLAISESNSGFTATVVLDL